MDSHLNLQLYPVETHSLIQEYLSQLSEIEQKACKIAFQHLGSSFNILKSNGFIAWKKKTREKATAS